MKRILVALFAIAVLVSLCFGPVFAANLERLGGYTELIDNTTFNNATTTKNTIGYVTLGNAKTAFFVTYAQMLANQSLTVVPQISQDNSTYQNISFYDIAGGTTLQTSEVIAANTTYYFWLPDTVVVPYTRINMVAANTTATNTSSAQNYIVGSVNSK
jgi:hypothetical protein